MRRYSIINMRGVLASLVLMLMPPGTLADALEGPTQDPDTIATPATPIDATLLTLGEVDARLTVPVAVGENGPFRFIIDTGAERTVVARELAGSLGLAAGTPVRLTSMTGTTQVGTVIVPALSIQTIGERHSIVAPALLARNLGAMGLLGIDTLRNHRVTIDLEQGTMAVTPSVPRTKRERHDPDEIVVSAKSVFGQLIVTDAYYGRTRIQVVLDTGSQVTMGNDALRRKVGRRAAPPKPIQLTSVTGETMVANYTMMPDIHVGAVLFGSMPVAFAEAAPFARFGLIRRPALLLGMDAMRSFRRVDIDFANRQVRFVMPKGTVDRSRFLSPFGPRGL
jgi:predicted aspartyl protease